MANETQEPRALSAALAAPVFHTRGGGSALHAANRHVERWAPETTAGRVRSMRSLSFVDRLVAPWIETAQRSASLRLFSQYARSGPTEREGGAVSWVFPRPWYQDELDWMAAARQVRTSSVSEQAPAPTMLTTRGTYVPAPRAQTFQPAMPSALYEYVAPSLSIAQPTHSLEGVGYGGGSRNDAYSPLVSLAAVQAAELMQRTVAPRVSSPSGTSTTMGRISPALRSVLTTMLERASLARSSDTAPTRSSMYAPEMVTPPAPRAEGIGAQGVAAPQFVDQTDGLSPSQLADRYAEQRTKIVELQRMARQSERETAVRNETARIAESAPAASNQLARSDAARTSEARANQAQRIETEIRERTADRGQQQANEAQYRQAQVERARLEEKIAQRTGAQRLHEQSRVDAAAHARIAALETAASAAPPPPAPVYRAPAEVTAKIAGLPPELAAYLMHRPERGMQAFAELNEVLRTAELLSRSAATNAPFEATRGPRVMMPAGIGGLVAAVDRAQWIADRPAQRAAQPMIGQPMVAPIRAPARAERDVRVPTLSWLAGPSSAPRMSAASTTALGATAGSAPAGLSHVAWADRWLARFAGAAPQSLDVLQAAAAGSPQLRMQALAAAAPSEVFVAPMFETETMRTRAAMPNDGASFARAQSTSTSSSAPTQVQPSKQSIERYDDSAETPDDVFLQIAAAAGRKRASAVGSAAAPQQPVSAPQEMAQIAADYERYTRADAIAHAAPSAPGAGLSAQLASSPFAAALRHVLPLPAAASFDVRSLFGSGLSATYLAGLLAPQSYEMDVAGAATSPLWSSWGAADAPFAPIEREAPSFDPTYVSPDVDVERAGQTPGMAELIESGAVSSAASAAGSPASVAAMAAAMEPLTTLRTALLSWTMTMQSSAYGAQTSYVDAPSISTSQSAPITTAAARAMIESMSLPMIGGDASPAERMASWGAPGMLAERAQDWSVAQERSASDLSLDFVTPELVLAARVYGLGPAEAAQAARLAIAGPGHLTAMAGAVDRTFVQAMAIEADRREGRIGSSAGSAGSYNASGSGSSPSSYSSTSASGMSNSDLAAMPPAQRAALTTAYPTASGDVALVESGMLSRYSSPGAAFGVERRAPRGAFLWPSATVAALGLNAASPDGLQSMPLAALELLAAQAVAEIGTYAALGEYPSASAATSSVGQTDEGAGRGERGSAALDTASGDRRASMSSMTMPNVGGGLAASAISEPGEADVLSAAAALIPTSRRARFDALYVALSQSSTGRTWSPASRAARALALAGRGDDAPTSSYERAATAWDVLPVVYATDGMSHSGGADSAPMSTGTAHTYALARAARASGARGSSRSGGTAGRAGAPTDFVEPMISVDGRPGLGALSARAGEALGSYVSPAAYGATAAGSSSSSSSAGGSRGGSSQSSYSEAPVARAPSAAQELVRTGRRSGRHGGGEVEIPSWFETAARKMLEDRSGNADGISMAELTLVNSAPSSHVAASTRTASIATSTAQPQEKRKSKEDEESPIDVDKTANEVYRQILTMMDSARLRNGH